jgi:phosphohistidine phosphatase
MRHGKSDWQAGAENDFSRPLSTRGLRDSPRMGSWLAEHDLLPARIVCSPAVRANETALLVCNGADVSTGCIFHDERLYHADLEDLLAVISDTPIIPGPLLLVGHNPGLENLLLYLAGNTVAHMARKKILPTATIARVHIPGDIRQLTRGSGQLLELIRPRDLPD